MNTARCFLFLEAFFLSAGLMTGQCMSKVDHRMDVLTPPDQAIILSDKIHFVVEVTNMDAADDMDVANDMYAADIADAILEVTPHWLLLEEVNRRRNYFHFIVRLDDGPNKINLRLIDGRTNEVIDEMNINLLHDTGGIETIIINIGASPIIWYKIWQEIPSSQPNGPCRYKFHTVEREAGCTQCHDLGNTDNSSDSDTQKSTSRELSCYSCHRDLLQGGNPHSPKMQSLGCQECHKENQGSGYRFNRLSSEACLSCHGDKIPSRQYVHGPLECGECWICHDPHKGRMRYLLRMKVNPLCRCCHAGKHYGKLAVNNHPILSSINNLLFGGREYKCTNCHDPHGSDVNKFLLLCDTHSFDEPCKRCHPRYGS